jgi:hypothetical protein
MIVVGFAGGREIEVGQQDLVGAAQAEVEEGIAYDGVVNHVGLVSVLENEDSRWLVGHGICWFRAS